MRMQTANRVDSTMESLTTGAKKGKKKETLMSSWMGPDYSKLCARGLVGRSDLEVVQVCITPQRHCPVFCIRRIAGPQRNDIGVIGKT